MAGKNRKENESLCEKSMQLMMNIIKLSSFSLATMNLRDKHSSGDALIPVKSFKSNSSMIKSKRSQAPLTSRSYLMEQDRGDHRYDRISPSSRLMILETKDDNIDEDGYFSDYIKRFHRRTKNEVNTDGKATAYDRKFHEKNSRLAAPAGVPPPPPPSPKK